MIAGLRARHSIEATFGAAMPIEKRLALQGAVPGCRASGGAHPSGDRREGAVRQRLHHALHQLPHRRPTCATARTTRPAARSLLQYLISQAADPRVPGALALEAEQRRHLGQPRDPALRGDGLPAVPPKDGTRRHRRRRHLLTPRTPFSTSTATERRTMNFLDGSLFPENQDKLVITAAPVRPRVDALGLSRGHRGHDGRAGAEGGRLLQRRRHRAAPARARSSTARAPSACPSSTS